MIYEAHPEYRPGYYTILENGEQLVTTIIIEFYNNKSPHINMSDIMVTGPNLSYMIELLNLMYPIQMKNNQISFIDWYKNLDLESLFFDETKDYLKVARL